MKVMWRLNVLMTNGVLADAHVPWACEAFSRFQCEDLVRRPQQL
ncbi:hypothetical protein NMG60_11025889 [Bertholletia excelsa]